MGVTGLRRHRLAWLNDAGWRAACDAASSPVRSDLSDWAARGLPVVVTMQSCAAACDGSVALGWAGPGRARVRLRTPPSGIARLGEFPHAMEALPLLPPASRDRVDGALRALAALGLAAHVYGSFGWQLVGGRPRVHAQSDLDVWVGVRDLDEADAAVALLAPASSAVLRIDGELLMPDGAAVAWREYTAWREGRGGGILIKRLDGASVECRPRLFHCSGALAA